MNKRQNSINLSEISAKRNNEGLLICLNCDILLPKRRQKYCSDECSYDWATKHNQNLMRSKFIKKTKGLCNHCKQQPLKQENRPYHINTAIAYENYKTHFNIIKDEGDIFFVLNESRLILDHINPIALGGAEFDESNLQILCWECNKIKTKKDHAEIAKARRIEKTMANGQIILTVNKKEDGLTISPTIL